MRTSNAAKLPALPNVSTGNPALDKWVQAVTERLEVREGMRGNPYERAVTVRDLRDAGVSAFTTTSTTPGSVLTVNADGSYSTMTPDAFAESIRGSKLYKDLMMRLDDVTRFDGLPDQVKAVLLTDLAEEAAKRGADIRRLENKLQSTAESLAYTVEEVTAAVEGSVAGVRETVFASASANTATAGVVTQLVAALDGTGSATAEESLVVIADRTAGLSAQKMIKVNAGNAVAGIGLMASEDPSGATESAFIVQADKFALVAPVNFEAEAAPSATTIGQVWYKPSTKEYFRATSTGTGSWTLFVPSAPFGVNITTGQTFINGSLTVNSGGAALQDAASGADGQGVVKGVSFLRAASAPATPIGGTFASPNATGWSDGVPADNNQPLWMTTRLFTSDGLTPQQAAWTTPAKVGTPSTGSKVQFSINGSTLWHDTPATNDYYMRSGTSTDNGATWTYGGAVKIKGEQGPQGDTGAASTTPGPTGTRGTIVTKTASSGTAANAAAAIAAVTSASGALPATPIKGDIVSHPTGALECTVAGSPGTWVAVSAYIHGSLVVTNSIAADKITAGTLTGFTIQTATTGARYVLDTNGIIGYSSGATVASSMSLASGVATFTSTSSLQTLRGTNTSSGVGVTGVGVTGAGVLGTTTSSGSGVDGQSASGYGGKFTGNATRPPISILSTVKPSNAATGGLMIYNIPGVGDRLCYCLGNQWYYLATNTAMP